ncbi:glycosyltransferase family 9 protein [Legionella sp. CNM-1927-20]|uniref:glycosyltransferase family 9 protein n=1 Tax=Legionella sp. CNM-1927-20 TaxID=3422221 RepID=UPI00403A9154
MTVPLIRTLQAQLPQAKITWVISRPAYDLVEGMQGVEFIVIPKPNSIKDYWQFKKTLKGRRFDVLLAAQSSFRANLLYAFIKAKRKIGYDPLRAKDGHKWFINETIKPGNDHTLEAFLKFAEVLGIEEKVLKWNLPITAADYQWTHHYLTFEQPVLLVNPAASKPERSWPISRYVEVIRYAQSQWQMQVVLTGGPGAYDRFLADAIQKQVTCIDLVGKTKPKQLLALISQATVLLCPDTGPSHMAAAVGTPVVALHAVTSAQVSGPYIYRNLAVDCYPLAVQQILKKAPNENKWGTHVHGNETMKLITVEAVLKKLNIAKNIKKTKPFADQLKFEEFIKL